MITSKERQYEDGDYDGAISDYTKAIESDPNYVSAWCNRGFVWRDEGGYDRAIDDFRKGFVMQDCMANRLCVLYRNTNFSKRN